MNAEKLQCIINRFMGGTLLQNEIVSSYTVKIEVSDKDMQIVNTYWDHKLKHYLAFKRINVEFEKVNDTNYLVKLI